MIQVVQRALDILEYIAKEPGVPKTLGEIAGHLNLNPGTCANIIKTLTTRHYIEKLDKQKGYILGALSYKLTGEDAYRKNLMDAGREELEKLTAKINESTLLGVLNGDTRVSVLIVEGSNDLTVQSNQIKKAYNTATGRLLIAYLSDTELERFIDKYGLPEAGHWKEVTSKRKLLSEINMIRTNKYAYHITDSQIIGLAVPVYKELKVIASLGIYMPFFRYKNWKQDQILKIVQTAANAISAKMK